ncbi:MAG TPA: hypothetical protein VK211_14270 [Kamptonema sp.]|nr:hypothetical protein [Kamptonema sp.]
MSCIAFIFTLGIPLASLFFRVVVNLTGGYKIPLAWTFSYYSALAVAFASAFILTKIETNWINKAKLAVFAVSVSIWLGSAVGLASAEAGVLGDPLEDPSEGSATFEDAVICAVMGACSGLGLGLGNVRWVEVLADRGVNLNLAFILCLSIAVISVSIALSFALF